MNSIDKRFVEFIDKHHVLVLATSKNNIPYTCSCFYVYIKELNMFVFTTDDNTRHGKEMQENKNVAANIFLETKIIGKIQGIQISGTAEYLENDIYNTAYKAYTHKFPIAILKKLDLWGLYPNYMKMTHNNLGFGKKLIWEKNINNK